MDNQPISPETPAHHPQGKSIPVLVIISVLFGLLGGAIGGTYLAGNGTSREPVIERGIYKEESAVIDVVKSSSPAVVSVVISRDLNQFFNFGLFNQGSPNVQQVGAGSGFFVTKDGLIITNKHVVSDQQASYSVVTSDGKSFEAKIMARDPVNDLAILKVDINDAPTLPLADSSQIQIGQEVVAIGNSLGQYENTVTSGIVSGIGRSIVAGGSGESEHLEGVIQTDAAINPGNSGGPLLNLAGQVIGINTAVDRQGQSVGFAIPASDATKALASFQKSGKISRPFLGVRYVMVTDVLAAQQNLARDYGALVTSGAGSTAPAVVQGSPAQRGGLVAGDIILEINGHRIDENNTLSRELKNYNAGDTVTLKLYHEGSEKTVIVTLGEA